LEVNLGAPFHKILNVFVEVELAQQFKQDQKRFASHECPDLLAEWVGTGHWRRSTPVVNDITAFVSVWWNLLQPNWQDELAN
jgi:hypothetical protein